MAKQIAQPITSRSPIPGSAKPEPVSRTVPARARTTLAIVRGGIRTPSRPSMRGVKTTKRPVRRPALPGLVVCSPIV